MMHGDFYMMHNVLMTFNTPQYAQMLCDCKVMEM